MASAEHHGAGNPLWTVIFPVLAVVMVVLKLGNFVPTTHWAVVLISIILLIGAVFSAVHHAEIVAALVGEPFGSIVLAVAVTVIEVGLIVALMLSAPDGGPTIARDTVYSAVMIVLTGLIGLCLLAGGQKHYEQTITVSGATSYLSVLGTLAAISLILPNYTMAAEGPFYSKVQLTAVALVSLALYCAFLFVQTVRHRDYFLPSGDETPGAHATVTKEMAGASMILLLIALTGVVLLAKTLSPQLNALISAAHLPYEFAGVIIAGLVLAPESIAAVRASLSNRPQVSINLALGSTIASIGLTIPVVTLFTAFSGQQLALGVSPMKTSLLALAMFVSITTLGTGRTTILQGYVHLALFIIFLVMAASP